MVSYLEIKSELQSSVFSLINGVVYHIDHKTRQKCAVVPSHLQEKLLRETHAGSYSGHFSGRRLYDTLRMSWWWETMFAAAEKFANTCPECVVAAGSGGRCKPLLHLIPVQCPFQVLGIDVIDLYTCHRKRQQTCRGHSRSFYQVANGVPGPRPESIENRQVDRRRSSPTLWRT